MSVCPVTSHIAADIGRLAEKRGDYIRFTRDLNDDQERPRIGRPHTLGLRKSDFTDVLSVKARVPAHSSVLEAGVVALLVKWLTRTWKRHRHRVVILVDAEAVLGAFAKGRSRANALQHHTRIVAAY